MAPPKTREKKEDFVELKTCPYCNSRRCGYKLVENNGQYGDEKALCDIVVLECQRCTRQWLDYILEEIAKDLINRSLNNSKW